MDWKRYVYEEVVKYDCYRLRALDFRPDFVIDAGGNIGHVARFCRALWRNCKVVSIEPNTENYNEFKRRTNDGSITILNCAIGNGNIYHGSTSVNGAGETYLSPGTGYPEVLMQQDETLTVSSVKTVTLPEIFNTYYKGGKTLIKIDIEGNEHTIFSDPQSMAVLKSFDYICMEVHNYAIAAGQLLNDARKSSQIALESLRQTHTCEYNNVLFYARKKI